MSVKWIDRVFEHSQAAGTPLLVLIVLADWADDEGECWPSIAAIARKCRLKDERHVRRVIHEDLEQKLGEVAVIIGGGRASAKGGLRSNRYRITVHMPDESDMGADRPPSSDDPGSETPHDPGSQPYQTRADRPPEPSLTRQVEPSKTRGTFDDDFETVWSEYPKRVDRGKALRAYTARRRAGVSADELLTAAQHYATAMRGTESRFVKHGATFFGPDEPFRDFVEGIPAGFGDSPQSKSMAAVDRVLRQVTVPTRQELTQ